jgi:thiol-disulfide isomerase/thioredoxin
MRRALAMIAMLTAPAVAPAAPPEALAPWAGRPVVVNAWASWCAPCRDELPLLDALDARLDDERAAVVAVNLDRSTRRAEAVVRTLGLSLPVVYDPEARVAAALAPPAMPTTWVLGADGAVLGTWVGALEAEDLVAIEALLAPPPDAVAASAP